ncbi:MAG: hypothetical protein K8R11_06820, partial [Methanococcoides sp.]|nr:hypothetical protein [Methanococcoides sp.]
MYSIHLSMLILSFIEVSSMGIDGFNCSMSAFIFEGSADTASLMSTLFTMARSVNGRMAFIRRSRGFVPERIELPFSIGPAIGVGSELNTTVTLAKKNNAYLSQYIGNTRHFETDQYHKQVVSDLEQLTRINPHFWGCDLHPEFNTTHFAQEKGGGSTISVQHHHAHIVSLMVDNLLPVDSRIIGIVLDGAGYGENGTIWGGEILEATYSGYERAAHLMEQPMPGGDIAATYP